jgi:hypothetical protein
LSEKEEPIHFCNLIRSDKSAKAFTRDVMSQWLESDWNLTSEMVAVPNETRYRHGFTEDGTRANIVIKLALSFPGATAHRCRRGPHSSPDVIGHASSVGAVFKYLLIGQNIHLA